eukprot:1267718-Pyramimonas_sp.AAC.1
MQGSSANAEGQHAGRVPPARAAIQTNDSRPFPTETNAPHILKVKRLEETNDPSVYWHRNQDPERPRDRDARKRCRK